MSPAERWKEIAAAPEEEIDLVEAALVIAAHAYPALDVAGYRARLTELGVALRRRLRGDISPADTLMALNHYLFVELGFRGNVEDYYDPRNSFLNDVLDRRLGIPITLCLVHIEVGRRVGLALHGVSFPGHFLVKCPIRDGTVVLDPYARGASLSLDDLRRRLQILRGGELPTVEMTRRMLAAASRKEMLSRILRNLKTIYLERRDRERALTAADLLVTLEPRVPEGYRDRAAIYADLECFRAALSDFQTYLMLRPGAEDVAVVRRRVVELERRASRLN